MEDPSVDGRIILRWNSGSGMGIDLAHSRDRWWALVNVLMNLWVLDFKLLPCSECCMISLVVI